MPRMSHLRFALVAAIVIGTLLAQDDAQPAARSGTPQPSPSRAEQSDTSATAVPSATSTSSVQPAATQPPDSTVLVITKKVKPSYPVAAEPSKLQGQVIVRVVVSETGDVESVEVISGNPILADAAMDAVKQWKFKPFIRNGKPVKAAIKLPFDFAPCDEDADVHPRTAEGNTAQIGAIHVDPSTSGQGVRFSPTPPKKVKNSDEVATCLLQALAVNGVDAPNATPWHALLTYDVFDEDGDNTHSGSIEVFSINDKKYRRVFQSDTRRDESRPLTEVATGSQLYHVGDQDWPATLELQVIREALGPWDENRVGSPNAMPDKIEWKVGKTKLSCIIIRKRDATVSDNGLPKFCFDPGTQVLRYTQGNGWDETVYNNVTQFQGRSVAADVDVTHGGKPYLTIHLAKIESLTQVDDALFAPPAGSPGPISGRVTMPGGVFVNQYLISQVMPTYPRGAHGKVNVRFVVGKDGHVIEADASDGPNELRKPVEDAIRRWMFRPYFLLGQPIEVQTNMIFQVQ